MSEPLDPADIQGLVYTAFGSLSHAAYLLLKVDDPSAARRWLAEHPPTRAMKPRLAGRQEDSFALQVAFTAEGLRAIGLDEETRETFPRAFVEGMVTPHRSRILGDVEKSAPEGWRWGGPKTDPVHVLLLCFASEGELAARLSALAGSPRRFPGMSVVEELRGYRPKNDREHFGFADGLSQPVIEGTGREEKLSDAERRLHLIKPGEVLLGYEDSYGKTARSATARPTSRSRALLPDAAREDRSDVGRNGSLLVFRQLGQEPTEFWKFVDGQCEAKAAGDPDLERERLAAKLIGRWRDGTPLVVSPDGPAKGSEKRNDFDFRGKGHHLDPARRDEDDVHGDRCPVGSHIRRSNPRDSLGNDAEESLRSVNRHRILRRGRLYGEQLPVPERPVKDGKERGLHFICLNSDVERQFEFVQNSWINNAVFGGVHQEGDPVVGLHDAKGCFTVPQVPLRRRLAGLSRFVHVRGGAYFFLPGLRAFEFLTAPRG